METDIRFNYDQYSKLKTYWKTFGKRHNIPTRYLVPEFTHKFAVTSSGEEIFIQHAYKDFTFGEGWAIRILLHNQRGSSCFAQPESLGISLTNISNKKHKNWTEDNTHAFIWKMIHSKPNLDPDIPVINVN